MSARRRDHLALVLLTFVVGVYELLHLGNSGRSSSEEGHSKAAVSSLPFSFSGSVYGEPREFKHDISGVIEWESEDSRINNLALTRHRSIGAWEEGLWNLYALSEELPCSGGEVSIEEVRLWDSEA